MPNTKKEKLDKEQFKNKLFERYSLISDGLGEPDANRIICQALLDTMYMLAMHLQNNNTMMQVQFDCDVPATLFTLRELYVLFTSLDYEDIENVY